MLAAAILFVIPSSPFVEPSVLRCRRHFTYRMKKQSRRRHYHTDAACGVSVCHFEPPFVGPSVQQRRRLLHIKQYEETVSPEAVSPDAACGVSVSHFIISFRLAVCAVAQAAFYISK